MEKKIFTFKTENNRILEGIYVSKNINSSILVVFCHGHENNKRDFNDYYEHVVSDKVMCIAIDFRKDFEFPVIEGPEDVLNSIKYISSIFPIKHVILYGASMGGAIAAMSVVINNKKVKEIPIEYLVSVSGISDMRQIGIGSIFTKYKNQIKNELGNNILFGKEYEEYSPKSQCGKMKTLLGVELVHSRHDPVIPYIQAITFKDNLEKENIKVNLITLEGENLGHVVISDINSELTKIGLNKLKEILVNYN